MTGRIPRHASLPSGGPQTFWGLIEWRSSLSPAGLCLVDETGERLTFAGYRSECERVAAGLSRLGVAQGTVVAWQLPTRIDSIVLCGALSRLGAVQVPVIPLHRAREVSFALAHTKAEVVMVPRRWRGRDYPAELQAIADAQGTTLVTIDGGLPKGDPAGLPPPCCTSPDGLPVRWIYFTSGTTGEPRGAMHTDGSLIWAAHAEVDCLDLGPDDRTTIVFPVAHIGGAFFFMAGLISGHGQIVISHFDEDSIGVLQREGVTYAGAGLSFQRAYLQAQRAQAGRPLFPSIRGFPHGGDAKRPRVHESLIAEIGGVGVLSGYGMTEFAMIASGRVHDPADKLLDRLGPPCLGIEVRIARPDGTACPAGVEGEIRARGPSLCLGYLDPAHDASAFDADGFFRTGDIGFLDEDGYLEVTGRQKDIIIRKGENISAVEVEDVLALHPLVSEVAVVGIPDDERGELCCAVVVPAKPSAGLDLLELNGFLTAQGLMRQKCPERLELRDALPRDFFAKVNKAQLRRELADHPDPLSERSVLRRRR
jgi:cyclohexanecarboxylate-CoA ligase